MTSGDMTDHVTLELSVKVAFFLWEEKSRQKEQWLAVASNGCIKKNNLERAQIQGKWQVKIYRDRLNYLRITFPVYLSVLPHVEHDIFNVTYLHL